MNIGYARVSTLDQHLDLQMQALKKAGCNKIFREKVSGISRQRPEFQRMLDQLRNGDTVLVWKLDRLAARPATSWKQWKPYARRASAFGRCPNPGPTPQLMLAS
jgi:DNA invertase Pin-like site-specific DNA recombinase